MSHNDPRSEASKKLDLISRGDYTPTPAGKATFFLLRAAEPVLQYGVLAHGIGPPILHRLELRTLPPGPPAHTGIAAIDNLGLSPSYAFLLSATSASKETDFPQPSLVVGGTLYTVGILTELVAEIQRKRFKSDPKNKGKAYIGGLWQVARHIKYGGYTIWRAGYALAGGGWALGAMVAALVGALFAIDFSTRAIPVLNEYCEKRYGEAWGKFKQQTPYHLVPFVY
ncbi:hypothetical protein BU25DRAFT_459244 [Macroventuria anomochaeta]|uniref:Uncharacterized protein n=1 Tax=Macroventuria anomochaeta TaxID=301207 RepID=A0ACB6RXN6_9PLEO|nr:uncharacterized protein BU25DRAFT_459244 [Macroventuria anomochaeta]KAF2626539.1 hypothetical protein BU25DRAFT_459244 [Macroventuria anomochaeta]